MSGSKISLTKFKEYTGCNNSYIPPFSSCRTKAFEALKSTRCLNSCDHTICISTMNWRPKASLQRTSTMLSLRRGLSGTNSLGKYSTLVTSSSGLSNGRRALSRLMTKSGCSPNTFLNVRSALGSKYLIVKECF